MNKFIDNMNDRKFNVGDKVSLAECLDIDICGKNTTIPIGEVGVIEDVDGDELLVDFPSYLCALTLSVSQVNPYTRRKDFLSRLQSLLREFDAEIVWTVFAIDARLRPRIDIELGKERISFDGVEKLRITASNILDFEKE